MKKFLVIMMMLLALIAIPMASTAGTKTLTFGWEQTLSPDFAGWKLYKADAAGGPYVLFTTIAYSGNPASTYTSAQNLISPDGQTKSYYFVLDAFDTSGNQSNHSNEVMVAIDFEAPMIPVQLKVVVTTPVP